AQGRVIIAGNGAVSGGSIDCGESGLCARMFAPIAALSEDEVSLTGRGSLLSRPMNMIEKPLRDLGAECVTNKGKLPIKVRGRLKGGTIGIDGSAGSQFLSGLLTALPLCGNDSEIVVSNLKSKPYVRMTIETLKRCGIEIICDDAMTRFGIPGGHRYKPVEHAIRGDWSSASFFLVAAAIAGSVRIAGLDPDSLQADRAILQALERAGARISLNGGYITVEKNSLKGFEFDATDCPDLFPPLTALACNCEGISVIRGAERLRDKESDRASALKGELGRIGADVRISGGFLEISGRKLQGGTADSRGDHRIAMACALAALNSEKGIRIMNETCVSKSYPEFFEHLSILSR
ncbi:MAG: 3-phosphoshikimate 1-carboxyvinyltransferase, partial [Deltaproteobacteria bacterium]|nr:3-phosphoshikimate 1-carboxyvinyltransferase [Deltaproteobacteria bacterium]